MHYGMILILMITYLAFFAFLTVFTFFGLCYSSDCHDKSGDRKALEATTTAEAKGPQEDCPAQHSP